jgi:hypothetical protein
MIFALLIMALARHLRKNRINREEWKANLREWQEQ